MERKKNERLKKGFGEFEISSYFFSTIVMQKKYFEKINHNPLCCILNVPKRLEKKKKSHFINNHKWRCSPRSIINFHLLVNVDIRQELPSYASPFISYLLPDWEMDTLTLFLLLCFLYIKNKIFLSCFFSVDLIVRKKAQRCRISIIACNLLNNLYWGVLKHLSR